MLISCNVFKYYINLLYQQQQQHPPQHPSFLLEAFSTKASSSLGLLPGGLFPDSPSSSSKKKHYKMASDEKENIDMNTEATMYPRIAATKHGKYGELTFS